MESYKKLVPQLGDDLTKFDMATNLIKFPESKRVNIKQVIYRTITLFVSALGRSYGVRKHSSFEIIEELKRRNELSEWTARKLSLAVAVACNIRLVHYSSKNKQDDDIYKEQEYGGREKFHELNKIVNKVWLIRCLAIAQCLQLVLKIGEPIRNFDDVFANNEKSFYIGLIASLGLDKDNITYTEETLKQMPTIRPYDCLSMVPASVSYQKLGLEDKAVKLFETLRRKLEKPYEAIDDSPKELEKAEHSKSFRNKVETITKVFEARALLMIGERFRAYEMTEEVLKANAPINPEMYVVTSICNFECKVSLWKNREALSTIRDLLRAYNFRKLKHWFNCALVIKVLKNITYSLIRIGKREVGLHWAKQGLHFVEENDLTSDYIQEFIDLIKHIKENEASDLADEYFYYRQKWS